MNIISSIWNYKCPRCRIGDLYVAPFDIAKPLNMNKRCSHCNQNFEPEPGYYFGAMFISYIWTGWLALAIVGVCIMVLGWSVEASFGLLIAVAALSYLFIIRISRSMYIHIDIKYDPSKSISSNKDNI